MNKRSFFVCCLIFCALILIACHEPTLPKTMEKESRDTETRQEEERLSTQSEPPVSIRMYCEKGMENGRADMTHLFLSFHYVSHTDEASGLRYHRLYRVCHDCGAEVDFGAVRCKTNSHFCEAGCL